MIDPSELVENFVSMLRDIPGLVAEMDGDPERIYAYHDEYPRHVSLAQAVHQIPTPAIIVAWQGTGPGSFGGADVWKHQLTLYLRTRETFEGDPPAAYYRMFRSITKGVPTSPGTEMLGATVHPSCYPMDLPSISRQTDASVDYTVPNNPPPTVSATPNSGSIIVGVWTTFTFQVSDADGYGNLNYYHLLLAYGVTRARQDARSDRLLAAGRCLAAEGILSRRGGSRETPLGRLCS